MTDGTHDTDGTDRSGDTDGHPAPLDGLAAQAALERVRERRPDRDPDELKRALDYAVADGTVTAAALDDEIDDLSKLVATAETRVELARLALADARETAASAPDLPTVKARLSAFESAVAAVEERSVDLGPSFTDAVDDRPDGVRFDVLDDLRRVEQRTRDVQMTADDLQFDLKAFERWLTDHGRRVRDLDADVDAFAASLDDLAASVDAVESAAGWLEATLRHRTTDLTVADLRHEFEDLRTWADRIDADAPADLSLAEVADRVDALDDRRERVGERLAERAEPAWRERFRDRVDAFEADIADQTPPVDWDVVQAALRRRVPDASPRD